MKMAEKKILVTGGAGFVGTNLINFLAIGSLRVCEMVVELTPSSA